MEITADDVDRAWFPQAPFGTRGYNQLQVDAFLSRVAATLDDRDSVTAADVRRIAFTLCPLGRRGGYDPAAVDTFLRLVESTLAERESSTRTKPYLATALDHSHARVPLWRRLV
ncbi:DivIVA domain-containing protein [Saccharomonospora piscinae]|uniref:Cell division protein DivIVA n=1 Tax=Saccharomonospora piscinae TaxID=687388 RepID=A0A1V9A657_SACPI|nr:DivIVA domain-containing protein [Saccharomonospora piscinae]OQO92528.1 cell division protein DivIVA [Saccharomonospora piscinae]TLW91766.1 DivIVA domain-containing protein [Saccharomonospora piscinae]